ncbi:hypothetical protein HK103_007317 [Boothiomyces macroporosus]|uniref:Ankyrin repeat protein n=1 Tax=Boothiomyces macroporosus TaxID=261099 RepID=A0AAD5UKU7_9FUNG|nr:hypothetical protein HK103_007317 [Boothiomyces macroporosus]
MDILINEIPIIAYHLNVVEYFQLWFSLRAVPQKPTLSFQNYKHCVEKYRYYHINLSIDYYTDSSFQYMAFNMLYNQALRMIPHVTLGCLSEVLNQYETANLWNITISIPVLQRLKYYSTEIQFHHFFESLIVETCSYGTDEQLQHLLDMCEADSTCLNLGLIEACRSGNYPVVCLLLQHNVDVNYRDIECTPLLLAILSDHFEIVNELLHDPRIVLKSEDWIYLKSRSLLIEDTRSFKLLYS